jgi:hypothetical protein
VQPGLLHADRKGDNWALAAVSVDNTVVDKKLSTGL